MHKHNSGLRRRRWFSEDERMTYGRLEEISNQLARMLRKGGCGRGDRVCLLLPKSPSGHRQYPRSVKGGLYLRAFGSFLPGGAAGKNGRDLRKPLDAGWRTGRTKCG